MYISNLSIDQLEKLVKSVNLENEKLKKEIVIKLAELKELAKEYKEVC